MALGWPYAALCDADGNELLPLTVNGPSGGDPLLVTQLNLGAVDVREETEDDTGGDGLIDYTAFTGSRGISLSIIPLDADAPSLYLDKLRGLMHPSQRTYLHLKARDWDSPRRILIRGTSAPHDLTDPQAEQQYQWKSPTGYLEALQEQTVRLLPATASQPGRSYPKTYPWSYPPAYPSGSQPFPVGGYLPVPAVVDIYGPCHGVTSLSDGTRTWKTTSALSIPGGTYWRVDPSEPSVTDADGGSHYGVLDFAVSDWQALILSPGVSRLTFSTTPDGPGCSAIVRYRPRSS